MPNLTDDEELQWWRREFLPRLDAKTFKAFKVGSGLYGARITILTDRSGRLCYLDGDPFA